MKRIALMALALVLLPAIGSAQTRRKSPLTHDQIHALQQALADEDCYNGRVDGVMGPKTRAGIACARRKHDLEGDNANELFRALNLNFTIEDSTGMGGIMRAGNRQPERRRDRRIDDTTSHRGHDMRDTAEARRDRDERMSRGDTVGLENKGKKEKGRKPVKP